MQIFDKVMALTSAFALSTVLLIMQNSVYYTRGTVGIATTPVIGLLLDGLLIIGFAATVYCVISTFLSDY